MVKQRHPLFVFFMIIITLGIYFWFWVYFVNEEMKKEYAGGPSSVLLLIFFFIPLVNWVVWLKWLRHIKLYQQKTHYPQQVDIFWLFVAGLFLMPIAAAYTQQSLNAKNV